MGIYDQIPKLEKKKVIQMESILLYKTKFGFAGLNDVSDTRRNKKRNRKRKVWSEKFDLMMEVRRKMHWTNCTWEVASERTKRFKGLPS